MTTAAAPIPEPSVWAMFGSGLAGLGYCGGAAGADPARRGLVPHGSTAAGSRFSPSGFIVGLRDDR
jgi:hypothetical protein